MEPVTLNPRPLTRFALAAALAPALLALLLAGCTNPFTPANPQPPSGDAIVEDFSSIDALLNTMGTAIQTRTTTGADAYIHAFAESTTTGQRAFYAYHDQSVKAFWTSTHLGQSAPEPWPLALERRLHSELSSIRQNDPYIFSWTRDTQQSSDTEIAPDVWLVHIVYKLYATPATSDPVLIVSGFADLLIQQVGSKWSIIEWHDRVDPAYGATSVDVKCFTYHRLSAP